MRKVQINNKEQTDTEKYRKHEIWNGNQNYDLAKFIA